MKALKLDRCKGIKLSVVLAEALKMLKLDDITPQVRRVDGWHLHENQCLVSSDGARSFFTYTDSALYTALQKKMHINMAYVETDTGTKLWQRRLSDAAHSKCDHLSTMGRTPEEALARVVCVHAFGKDQINKQDFDLSIFSVDPGDDD